MTRTLTGIRPSLWARCPTAAVFQGRGETEAEIPDEVKEYFLRGQVFEEIVVRQIEAKHGKENVERQVVIPIDGIGEGHADAYIKPEKALVEIKSTTAPHPNSDIFGHAVQQLRIYLAFHPEAERGFVYMLDPNKIKAADIYEVKLTDDDLREIVEQRQYIVEAVNGGEIHVNEHGTDYRPCTRPSQARGRMCPFSHVCFDGWEAPPANSVPDPAALDAASRLAAVKDQIRTHEQAIKALDEGKKAAEAELLDLTEPGDNVIGPYLVKRSDVQRSPSFSLKAYEAAGMPIEPLAEFFRPGAAYSTFRVSKADESGDVDYGDAPF